MSLLHLPALLASTFLTLACWLDRRSGRRLPQLLLGILFARGRRTVTSWFRAAGITDEFRPAYRTVCAEGRGPVVGAGTQAQGTAWAGADVRQAADLAGQAGWTPGRLAASGVRAVRQGGDQDDQDVPGHLASRRGPDPRGAGSGGRRLAGLLLHQGGGHG